LYAEVREKFIEGWVPEDYYVYNLLPDLNPVSISGVSTIKSFDHRLFKGFSVEPLAVINSGVYYNHLQQEIDDAELNKIFENYNNEVVIKRDRGPSGGGITFKHSTKVKKSDFKKGYDYVIQPSVKQHKNINEVYQKSVNTLRIVTIIDRNQSTKELYTVMRFGMSGARNDNMITGGGFILFNEEGRAYPNAYDNLALSLGKKHPDTDYEFKNLWIPSFKEAIDCCKIAHKLFPYVRLIAWDVYIDESGTPKLIEWNAKKPGMWWWEALVGPLWSKTDLNFFHST